MLDKLRKFIRQNFYLTISLLSHVIFTILFFIFYDSIQTFVSTFPEDKSIILWRDIVAFIWLFSHMVATLIIDIYIYRWIWVERLHYMLECFINLISFIIKYYDIILWLLFSIFLFLIVFYYA